MVCAYKKGMDGGFEVGFSQEYNCTKRNLMLCLYSLVETNMAILKLRVYKEQRRVVSEMV